MPSDNARVLVMTPDFDHAVGGVKIHYQVVDALNSAGVDALVVHRTPGFRCTWFENRTRVTHVADVRVDAHDLLVVPDEWVAYIPGLPAGIPKAVFHQNAYHTFSWGFDAEVVRDAINRPDVLRVVVVSDDNAAYLRYAFPDLDIRRLRYTIDPALFTPRDMSAKRRQLAYMPRRRAQEATDVLSLLRCRGALDGWSVVAIDGLNEADVAARLQQSAIFLSFSQREGLPLPPGEAMGCGCVVVGFHGFGGRDHGDHAIWVPEGDVVEFARTVEDILSRWDAERDGFDAFGRRGSDYIHDTFNEANTRQDCLAAFRVPLDGVAAGPSVPLPDTMWQAQTKWQKLRERAQRATRVLING